MSINKDRLHFLIKRHIAGTLNEQELLELKRFGDTAINRALNELLDSTALSTADIPDDAIPSEKLYREILRHPQVMGHGAPAATRHLPFRGRYTWWASGIAALLCVGILLFRFYHNTDAPAPNAALSAATILPGGNKATLKLADGSAITLNEAQSSIIVDGDHITYGDGTQLISNQRAMGEYLELTIPRGGTYHVTLSDGTEVWLNADSRFRYPSQFNGDQRIVELDGEAYFEVAKQQRHNDRRNLPFLVKTRFQTVEVLGTQFNISAYGDEAAEHTTLVEGLVQITADGGTTRQLFPNQQGIVTANHTHIKTVDVNNFTAWKDGYFAFSDAHIRDVMQVIARWYDIQVDYNDETLDARFGGTISRFSDFETLLQTIALTGSVKFKITGRRVTVMT